MTASSTKVLTESIKEFAIGNGSDLVGIAPLDRFESAPIRTRPVYYMPDATCVISIGIQMGTAIIDNVRMRRTVYSYNHFFKILSEELDALTHRVSRYIWNKGHKAYTIPAVHPYHPTLLRGDLSHKHAAVAAGLGEIGWNNLFLSPEFGPRQMLSSIVTNAPLKGDPLMGEKLCDPAECGYKCAKNCYVQALGVDSKEGFTIYDSSFEHGKHVKWRCLWGCGSLSAVMPMPKEEPTIEELRIGRIRQELQSIKKTSSLGEVLSTDLFLTNINEKKTPWCWIACLAVCPVGL